MAKFKIGQTVTCIDVRGLVSTKYKEKLPVVGGWYVVRAVVPKSGCIRLLSIINAQQVYIDGKQECSFSANRFASGKLGMPFFTVQGPRLLPVATFTAGPGDVPGIPSSVAWFGMRAFSVASAATGTQKAVRLIYPTTLQVDYFTQADGTINLAVGSNGQSHATNVVNTGGQATGTIWYDQSGNGRDLDLTAGGTGPAFTTSALGTSPGFTFSGTSYGLTAILTQTAPLSFSTVVKVTGGGSDYTFGNDSGGTATKCAFSAGVWYCFAGGAGSENVTAANNAFHAGQFTLNSTSSHTYVDGVESATGQSIGTALFNSASLIVGDDSTHGTKLVGVMMEIGLFNGSLASVQSLLNANQHGTNGYNF